MDAIELDPQQVVCEVAMTGLTELVECSTINNTSTS